MLLLDAQAGAKVQITGFVEGRGLVEKLRQLGLVPGGQAKVLRRAPFDGPFLIEINGREIALGKGVASKIEVEELTCESH